MSGDVHVRLCESLRGRFPRATQLVIVVKGSKTHALTLMEECRAFLEDTLMLTLNMDKIHITHVNDSFIFLGYRTIRKRGPRSTMGVVATIPMDRFKTFALKIVKELSWNYSENKIDMVVRLNRKLTGLSNF